MTISGKQLRNASIAASKLTFTPVVDSNLSSRAPASVLQLIGNASIATLNGLTPTTGDAYVATDAGTPTAGTSDALVAGSVTEFDGTSWIEIVAGSGGFVPSGTRAVLATQTALISPYTDGVDDGKVVSFSGSSNTGSDEAEALDGNNLFVNGDGGVFENSGFIYSGIVPSGTWQQYTGAGQVTAGAGLTKTDDTLDVGDVNKGVQANADDLQIDASEIASNGLAQVAGGGNEHLLEVLPNNTDGGGVSGLETAVNGVRIATTAAGNGIAGGGGDALSVDTASTVTFSGATWTFPTDELQVTGVPDTANDATNKAYVDSVASGLDLKDSVRVATVDILDNNTDISGSPTYNNTGGASGRGQITATLAVSDTFSVDGVSLTDNDRILVKDEDEVGGLGGDANGLYFATITGTSLTLDRTTDFDEDAEVTAGAFTFVEEGTSNSDTGWVLITDNPITIGGASGTAIDFTQFSGAGSVDAGAGLTQTGSTIDVGDAQRGVQVNANDIEVDGSEISSTGIEQDTTNSWQVRIAAQGDGLTGGGGTLLAVQAADDSVAVAAGGVSAAVPTLSNKNMTGSTTTTDGDQATATTVAAAPGGDSRMELLVNGVQTDLRETLSGESYISGDGGTTARTFANVVAGDTIHWNGSVAGFELDSSDRLDLVYVTT